MGDDDENGARTEPPRFRLEVRCVGERAYSLGCRPRAVAELVPPRFDKLCDRHTGLTPSAYRARRGPRAIGDGEPSRAGP